jgi:threonine/homoserine/homoserine lactone efflux protein
MITACFAKGFLIGLSIAAPVGAIGILCIRRTLSDGMLTGLLSGLGAATADAAYAAAAVLGVHAVSDFLESHQAPIRLVGGAFLAYLGIRTYLSQPGAGAPAAPGKRLAAAYGSTLALTLANPSTVISFTLVFAALGLGAQGGAPAGMLTVTGVFAGSAVWWLFLSGCVGLLRSRIDFAWMRIVNRIAGAVLLALGIGIMCRF